jgi:hypothetical protein
MYVQGTSFFSSLISESGRGSKKIAFWFLYTLWYIIELYTFSIFPNNCSYYKPAYVDHAHQTKLLLHVFFWS